jgi:AhpD family alkylhydroperoxidase
MSIVRTSIVAATVLLGGFVSVHAISAEPSNQATFAEIEQHFGVVPSFFNLFPEGRLPAMWQAYKNVHLDPDTALDAKTKQLIGLAVAAAIECSPCIYIRSAAATANGASFQEIQEATAIFAVEDDWSHYLTEDTFQTVKQDTNELVTLGTLKVAPATN